MQTSIPQLVADLGARFQELETTFHRAYWDSQVAATPDTQRRRAALELEVRRMKGNKDHYRAVLDALDEEVHDPVVRRQLEILRLSLMGNQMGDEQRATLVELSSSIDSEFSAFRATVNGERMSDNEIVALLRKSSDLERRKEAWYASKQVGVAVAERVVDLVRTRNEIALALGFADYYRMSLELQELPEQWLFDRLDELDELTRAPYASWKEGVDDRLRKRFGVVDVRPWHYADPFFQETPSDGGVDLDPLLRERDVVSLVARTFAGWGVEIGPVLSRSSLYPADLKSQHAFCLDVDRTGDDVRILANVVPGERWITVMLHEAGHAAYDVSIDGRLPYLLHRPTHIFVTEAIAILCGRLPRRGDWLRRVADIDDATVDSLEIALGRARTADSLQFARWGLVMTHFERELYSDPGGDLDERWWSLVERFQMIDRPDHFPSGGWASKVHLAVAPVYYQNYLLGELLASQLTVAMAPRGGSPVGDPAVGEFLVDRVFRAGALMRWDSLIEEATGSELSVSAFADEIKAEPT